MQIKKIEPHLSVYSLHPDRGEDMCWRCTWARITLDHDNFTMSSVSDCGDYSYRWSVTESEPFLNLMCRIDKSYLMDKISSRSLFDLEKSKKETIENIRSCYSEKEDYKSAISEIKDIENVGEEGFFIRASEIRWLDFESIEVVKEYPPGAITFAELFIKYLQPELRREANLTSITL